MSANGSNDLMFFSPADTPNEGSVVLGAVSFPLPFPFPFVDLHKDEDVCNCELELKGNGSISEWNKRGEK